MNVKKQLEALDTQIMSGDILGAFEKFFADDCVTLSNENDKTNSKAQKHQGLKWFFDGMIRTNRIERMNSHVDGDITLSEFMFDFTDRIGKTHLWHEVIRRTWRDGKVVEEKYFLDLAKENPFRDLLKKEITETAPRTNGNTKAVVAEAASDKKPASRSSKKAPVVKDEVKPAKAKVKAGK